MYLTDLNLQPKRGPNVSGRKIFALDSVGCNVCRISINEHNCFDEMVHDALRTTDP